MTETTVTRGGQITLTKDIREKLDIAEGDTLIVNTIGETAVVSKKDIHVFEKHGFLPENFDKILESIRKFSLPERLKRLGIQ